MTEDDQDTVIRPGSGERSSGGFTPRTVGRYVLLEERGRGGLGQVFAAYDPQLARRVAVKVVLPGASGSRATEAASLRLLREAQAAARVAHPNVVGIHDSGRDGDVVYIAMELVEGVTLSAWLRVRDRPWTEIRDVFAQAGAGLAAAHEQGLVHRDFKPANVMVGDDGRVRVLDFGLARGSTSDAGDADARVPEGDIVSSKLTQTGCLVGTPAYLAPEQLRAGDVGAASDQFSFCVALYEALFGAHPFPARSLTELPELVAAGLPPQPRGDSVPRWLYAVIQRGLRARPEGRYASMAALVRALGRDRRRRDGLAIGVLAVALAGGGVVEAVLRRAPVETTTAERSRVDALVEQARAAAARFDYIYPPRTDPEATTAYATVLELERFDGPQGEVGRARATQLRHEFSQALSRIGDEVGDREGGGPFAADFYAQAVIFDPANAHALDRISMTRSQVAELAGRAAAGEYSEQELAAAAVLTVVAEPDPNKRVKRLRGLYTGPHPPSALQTAQLECVVGPEEKAAIHAALQRSTGPSAPPDEPPTVARSESPPAPAPAKPTPSREEEQASAKALTAQGRRALAAGKWDRAESLSHRALEHNPKQASALAGLAEVQFERGRYPSAIALGSKAVKANPRRASYRLLLGDAFQKVFEYRKARSQYEAAADLGSRTARARLKELAARTAG